MESTGTAFGDVNQLPEECLSHVISLTSPRDACVCSVVSRAFQSAADSDATWQTFLPSDYPSILSQAVKPVEYTSNKELYFRLCNHLFLIDGGRMSFGLEKSNGAKRFMLSARALSIIWGDHPHYWSWIALPESRFSECAELNFVCWLEIHGRTNSKILTPHTVYAAYLIFKLTPDASGLSNPFPTAKITLAGDIVSQHFVSLKIREREEFHIPSLGIRSRGIQWVSRILGIPSVENVGETSHQTMARNLLRGDNNEFLPAERQDGWLEVELGEFYSGDGIDGEVDMSLLEIEDLHGKNGLIVEGIERSLHNKKKELNKLICELEQKAIEEPTKNETLEDLGQIVKWKERLEKKLNNSYSLGRDHSVSSGAVPSILPLYNGKMKSHSFHNSRQKESITIFDTLSDSSSVEEREDNESGYSGSSSSGWETENPEVEIQEGEEVQGEIAETSRVYSNPIYNEIEMDLAGEERKLGLKRTNSSTY